VEGARLDVQALFRKHVAHILFGGTSDGPATHFVDAAFSRSI
jgi:hypothetical protein